MSCLYIFARNKSIHVFLFLEGGRSPRRRTRATEWRLHWGPCGLIFGFVWLLCFIVVVCVFIFMHFLYFLHALISVHIC